MFLKFDNNTKKANFFSLESQLFFQNFFFQKPFGLEKMNLQLKLYLQHHLV